MKHILTLLSLVLFCFQGQTQSPKKVFIEGFSQASCGACLFYNFNYNDLLQANEDKVVALKYQIAWPDIDQMNLDNPEEVDERLIYYYGENYDLNRIPVSTIDGILIPDDCNRWEGCPHCLDQSEITAANTPTSSFDLVVNGDYDSGMLTVTGSLTATEAISGDFKLRLALAEQTIYLEDIAEGTIVEGIPGQAIREQEFYDVLKKFVGGSQGIELSDSWAIGDSYVINETLDVSDLSIYEFTELEIVAFVQNDSDQVVLQAENDRSLSLSTPYQNNASLLRVELTEEPLCIGSDVTSSARLKIRNGGNSIMTSADISISVNGGPVQLTPWSGSLGILESMYIEVPFNFIVAPTNSVEVTILNPNGQMDENISDGTLTGELNYVEIDDNFVTLELFTDQWPDDISWRFSDDAGNVLIERETGHYLRRLDFSSQILYMPSDGCYSFTIDDEKEDGLCCTGSTNGYYRVKDPQGNILFEGDKYEETETNYITLNGGDVIINNAVIVDYSSGEVLTCEESSLTSVLTVQNQSTDLITSVDIESFANGISIGTDSWVGSIEPFELVDISLEKIALSADTDMTYSITMVNGVNDVYADGNDYNEFFKISADAAKELTMTLNTDCFPEENTWEIINSSGEVVMSGGPYEGQENTMIVESFFLSSSDCYEFVFTDSYGDGLYASQWNECSIDGNLSLVDDSGTVIYYNDGSYALITVEVNYLNPASESVEFNYEMEVGVDDSILENSLSISPNPTSNKIFVDFELGVKTDMIVTIHDMMGAEVKTINLGSLHSGVHKKEINLNELASGIYMIQLNVSDSSISKKIVLTK